MKKKRRNARRIPILICWIVLILGSIYIARWYASRVRIEREAEEYRSLYRTPAPTEIAQLVTPEAVQTVLPAETALVQTASPSETALLPSVDDKPRATDLPAESALPVETGAALFVETPAPTIEPAAESDEPASYVFRLPTAPPIQESFAELLNRNPDTIGFLTVGDIASLPVVWRENDNSTYLDHNFSGEIAPEGTLFLDGYNRLIPADNCLIVYGHNMQNGTMFGRLHLFESASAVRSCPLISFDTIYENGTYAPFSAFRISADTDFRKFMLDESEFADFVSDLRKKSAFSVPLDVSYGDQLLLLVTCDYDEKDGRFVLALRKLRDTETAGEVASLIRQVQ